VLEVQIPLEYLWKWNAEFLWAVIYIIGCHECHCSREAGGHEHMLGTPATNNGEQWQFREWIKSWRWVLLVPVLVEYLWIWNAIEVMPTIYGSYLHHRVPRMNVEWFPSAKTGGKEHRRSNWSTEAKQCPYILLTPIFIQSATIWGG
jgi:hypothetical protein